MGKTGFTLPEGSYKLRINSGGEQYWSEVIHVIGFQTNEIELELSELVATSNPRPKRFDGEPPLYSPLLASSSSINRLFNGLVVDEPKTYYFISDHLGTGQLLVDDNQQIVWQGEYSPFGQVDVVVDLVGNDLRFPGQYFDDETGLYYNWNRYYDPETGRYVSADPIGLRGGVNLYGYVGGNPVNWIDPMGLFPCDCHIKKRCEDYCKSIGSTMKSCSQLKVPLVGTVMYCKCNTSDCDKLEKDCTGTAKNILKHVRRGGLHPKACTNLEIALKRAMAAGCGGRKGVQDAMKVYYAQCVAKDWSKKYPNNTPIFPEL